MTNDMEQDKLSSDDVGAARGLAAFLWRRYREMGERRLCSRLYEALRDLLHRNREQTQWTIACLSWDIEHHYCALYPAPAERRMPYRPTRVGRYQVPRATVEFIRLNIQRLQTGSEVEFQRRILTWLEVDPDQCGFHPRPEGVSSVQRDSRRRGGRDYPRTLRLPNNKRRRCDSVTEAPVAPLALRHGSMVPGSRPFPGRPGPAPVQYRDVGIQVTMRPEAATNGSEVIARKEHDAEVAALKRDIEERQADQAYLFECGRNWKRELDELKKKYGET